MIFAGSQVRLAVDWYDFGNVLADPTTVTLKLFRGLQWDSPESTVTVGIAHPYTGHYYFDRVMGDADVGVWSWEWVATGAIIARDRGSFVVQT